MKRWPRDNNILETQSKIRRFLVPNGSFCLIQNHFMKKQIKMRQNSKLGKQEYNKTINIRKCIRIIYIFFSLFANANIPAESPSPMMSLMRNESVEVCRVMCAHTLCLTWEKRIAELKLDVYTNKKKWNSPSIYFVNASINVHISCFVINHIWYLI